MASERIDIDYQALVLALEPDATLYRTDTGYEIRDSRNRKHRKLAQSSLPAKELIWRRAWRHLRQARRRRKA